MAANLTVTTAPHGPGIELIRSPRAMELIKIVGSGASVDDTGTYTVQTFTPDANTIIIGGAFDISSLSGAQITVRTKIALGNATNYVWVAQGI